MLRLASTARSIKFNIFDDILQSQNWQFGADNMLNLIACKPVRNFLVTKHNLNLANSVILN